MQIVGIVELVLVVVVLGVCEGLLDADGEGVEGVAEEVEVVEDEDLEGEGEGAGGGVAGAEEAAVGAEEGDGGDGVGEGFERPGREAAACEVGGVGDAREDVDKERGGELLHGSLS